METMGGAFLFCLRWELYYTENSGADAAQNRLERLSGRRVAGGRGVTKRHPVYSATKAGDAEAALDLVEMLVGAAGIATVRALVESGSLLP